MIEVNDRLRKILPNIRVRWVEVQERGEAGGLPEADVEARDTPDLAEEPVAQAYRSLFWSVDVDPTKRRPAGEALARRLHAGGLPSIHPLVDAYNQVSAVTMVPLSAFDLDTLEDPLQLDAPQPGDALDAIGEDEPLQPTGRHPVWRDALGLVGLAAYRDGRRTAIGPDTEQALVVTLAPPDLPAAKVQEAFGHLERRIETVGWRFEADPRAIGPS